MRVNYQFLVVTAYVTFAACAEAQLSAKDADPALREQAVATLRKAAEFYRGQVASHGGYVYHYTLDLQRRWGEGEATPDQIWVQPPGTPAVGMAYLQAYKATRDRYYLEAATEAAEALLHGHLASGGWTNAIDFDPRGQRAALYRNGQGKSKGKNNSTLDDGISQNALRLLMRVDQAYGFQRANVHQATQVALKALLAAQFPNGGFPQIWTGPVSQQPVVKANYPNHDWRTEGRIKNYWDMYTLNDGLAGTVTDVLIEAHAIYDDPKYRDALTRLGDFLILAQMPDPQPAWAQQYNYQMQPIWARRFEPAAITGGESQDVLATLIKIYRYTGDVRYLEPIPRAIAYLRSSQLPDGRLARFYELKTNKPLYMTRQGDIYTLTYDDANLPDHYGWKVSSQLDSLARDYQACLRADGTASIDQARDLKSFEKQVRRIIDALDEHGRWVSVSEGESQTGQLKFPPNTPYLSSAVFNRNVAVLSEYVALTR